jgi:hypothetical protein
VLLDRKAAEQRRLSAAGAATVENLVGLAEIGLRLRPHIRNEVAPRGRFQCTGLDLLLLPLRQRLEAREDVVKGHEAVLLAHPGCRMIPPQQWLGGVMRKIVLVAACAVGLSSHAATAQIIVELSAKDPKFNTPECVSMREKARTYSDGTLAERAGTFIIGAGAPGGGLAVMAGERRKREIVLRDVELACMSNPPNRAYLDPAATIGK